MSSKNRNSIEKWCAQYEKVRPDYVRYTRKAEMLFEELLHAKSIGYHLIESRTKEASSFREKIVRASKAYSNPLSELTDLSGLRIITYYQSDVLAITGLIKDEFEIDSTNSIEHSPSGAEFGYRSAHYVVRLSEGRARLPEWSGLAELKLEIQVRTVLQHAWAAISHKLQYKREDDVPEQLRRKLFRLSALFELADDEFISLRNESAKLSEKISEELSAGNQNIKIDYVSLNNFLEISGDLAFLCDLAERAGFSFGAPDDYEIPDNDDVSDLIQLASAVDVMDISQLGSILNDAASSWGQEYLVKQYKESDPEDDSDWFVSASFICGLILIGAKHDKVDFGELVKIGWDEGIAARTISTARTFWADA